jgi:CheY-like chemotaxis protein
MDGVEATHAILEYEEDENQPHIPIVALTANALQGDRERFLAEGLDEYISKPIKMTELLYILNKFISEKLTVEITEEPVKDQSIIEDKKEETKADSIAVSADSDPLEDTYTSDNSSPNKVKILIAKQSTLSSKILSKIVHSLGYSYDIALNREDFAQYIGKEDYLAVFTDELFLDLSDGDAIKSWDTTFVFTTEIQNSDLKNKITYHKVDSLMHNKGIDNIIKKIEENK